MPRNPFSRIDNMKISEEKKALYKLALLMPTERDITAALKNPATRKLAIKLMDMADILTKYREEFQKLK